MSEEIFATGKLFELVHLKRGDGVKWIYERRTNRFDFITMVGGKI